MGQKEVLIRTTPLRGSCPLRSSTTGLILSQALEIAPFHGPQTAGTKGWITLHLLESGPDSESSLIAMITGGLVNSFCARTQYATRITFVR